MPEPVYVTTPSGKTGQIDPGDLQVAEEGGARIATPEEVAGQAQAERQAAAQQALHAKYYESGVGKALQSDLESRGAAGLRGFTFGLSDKAVVGLGGEPARQRLNELREVNPFESAGSEFMGAAAPIAAGIGPPGLLARGAGAAGAGATRLAGGGIAARLLGGGVAGAIEGAAYGAGGAVSESALGDTDLTAEKLVAAAGHGALLGGALGVGGSALGAAFGGIFGRARAVASEEAANSTGIYRDPYPWEAEGAGGVRGIAPKPSAPNPRGAVGEAADEATYRALGGSPGQYRRLIKQGVEKADLARAIREDVEATSGKRFGAHNVESLYEHVAARKEQVGEQIGGTLKDLDKARTGIAPDARAFITRASDEIIQPHVVGVRNGEQILGPGAEEALKPTQDFLNEIRASFGDRQPTFEQWHNGRKLLDSKISYNATNNTPATAALKRLRGMYEKELEASAEQASKAAGVGLSDQYVTSKELYSYLTRAEEMLLGRVSRGASAQRFGLGDKVAAGIGGVIGGWPGALIGGAINHVARARGEFITADVLSRLAGRSASVDARLQSGVQSLLGSASKGELAPLLPKGGFARASATKAAVMGVEEFKRVSDNVRRAASDPGYASAQISEHTKEIAPHAPKTAAAMAQVAMRGSQFLAAKLPQARSDPNSLTPQAVAYRAPSSLERGAFARYHQAVNDPASLPELAKAGKLTREHVEAMKAVYPKLYDRMRTMAVEYAMSADSPMTYQEEVRLGTLLDAPTNATMTPEFMRAIAATYATTEEPQGMVGNGKLDLTSLAAGSAGDAIEKGSE